MGARAALVLLGLFLLVSSAQPMAVAATRGVAIDIGAIDIAEPLVGGGIYSLPPIVVRNPGTEAASYRMGSAPAADRPAPDPAWFTFEPEAFDLAPGGRQTVNISLRLPEDPRPDAYEGLITAQLIGDDSGARVGAAAATRLTLAVRSGGPLDDLLRTIGDLFGAWLPWSVVVPSVGGLVLVGFIAVRVLSRRYAFRIERRG